MRIRPYAATDVPGIVALIDGVYREHGDAICLAGADRDLLDIPSRYLEPGGAFVVLDDEGKIRGSHAVLPFADRPGICTFRRLYLDPALRGAGWGETLMRWAFDWSRKHGLSRVEFWSDTRFERAHRFFRRLGFEHDGQVREMHDGLMPYREYFFYRELSSETASAPARSAATSLKRA